MALAAAAARTTQDNERLAAFAFAGANMVAEIDVDGTVLYAAGAFRTEFGRGPETFVGESIRNIVAAEDHDALDLALSLLVARGRLQPMAMRMANGARRALALAGLALPVAAGPPRLCLTFAMLPAAHGSSAVATGPGFARAAERRLWQGDGGALGLLEVVTKQGTAASTEAVGRAIETIAPDALTGEIAPGRFGLLGGASGARIC